jgi:MFS family permease
MSFESSPDETAPAWLRRLPRVFRHRNYRLFYAGQGIALIGAWIQTVALSWLVYRLTHSVFLLGLVSFVAQAPIFFIAPFGGAIADRYDRRSVFIVTRALCMVQAVVLTVLTMFNWIAIDTIILLALVLGIITAVETPVRQSFTVDMVGREDLRQAIAFNAMLFNLARTIGPALGGIIVAVLGEGLCFSLNAVSYAAVLTSLFSMKTKSRITRSNAHPFDDLKQGFRYAVRHPHLRMVLFLSAICSCFGTSYLALMPAFAQDILHEGRRWTWLSHQRFRRRCDLRGGVGFPPAGTAPCGDADPDGGPPRRKSGSLCQYPDDLACFASRRAIRHGLSGHCGIEQYAGANAF